MRGEGGTVDVLSIPDVIAGLRALLAAIDAGRVEATDLQRAYLAGAVDSLEMLPDSRC